MRRPKTKEDKALDEALHVFDRGLHVFGTANSGVFRLLALFAGAEVNVYQAMK